MAGQRAFLYCESTEGGMETACVSEAADLCGLPGWMTDYCREEDEALAAWMGMADVGDYFDHRLGICIRVRGRS